MTTDELRKYNRIKQRESRQRRGIGKKQPVAVPVAPASYILRQPQSGSAQFHCSIRLDLEEATKRMTGPQIHALMYGIAQVLSVNQLDSL